MDRVEPVCWLHEREESLSTTQIENVFATIEVYLAGRRVVLSLEGVYCFLNKG